MKNLRVLVLFIFLSFTVKAQYVSIPDAEFRAWLMNAYPTCFNGNMLDTTCASIVNATQFVPSSTSPINNWYGCQFFKNVTYMYLPNAQYSTYPTFPATLQELSIGSSTLSTVMPSLPNGLLKLYCTNTNFTSLGTLPNSLTILICNNNPGLHDLGILPNSLQELRCDQLSFTTLPLLPATLKSFSCNQCSLSTLPVLPGQLTGLSCAYNNLTSLPALPVTLENLGVDYNQLTALPALPVTLNSLSCIDNAITSLPTLPQNLKYLSCSNNELTSLPLLPDSLRGLDCWHNQLTSLPNFPDSLEWVECEQNYSLSSIPPFPSKLASFKAPNCNIQALPAIPASLTTLFIEHNPITCLPVLPSANIDILMDDLITCLANTNYTSLRVFEHNNSPYTDYGPTNHYPVCTPVNNANHCPVSPVMVGHVFNDNNSNGIKDVNEPYRHNVKVQSVGGAYTFSNINGYYELPADNMGSNTITAMPPNYFAAVPLQYNYNFSTYDTLVIGDFALHATAFVDSLSVNIIPLVSVARPGFSLPYFITYTNEGSTTLSPNLVFNYDNFKLIYDSSSNASVINTGNSLTLSETGFVAGQQNGFVAYFRLYPFANIGESVKANAHISANGTSASDTVAVEIRGSFDPNDKTATPTLTTAQLINGDYIDYIIRFQNTGNDTAFNVVIADTLSSLLQTNSIEIISSSHPCKATVKNGIVYFEFLNILLPDSNINELKSHGYVSFRIKPQNNLVVNDSVPNKAAIYFDYNSPVITNTAVTTIVDPSTVPLKLISFTVHKGVGSTANVYWQTSNEINVNGYNIEMSTDGRNYKNIAFEKARGDQYDSYTRSVAIPNNDVLYFRLKMTDVDGNYSYSNIAILKNDHANTSFSFLHNPVKDELIISLQDESLQNTTATILNAQGAVIKKILLQHDVETVDIKSLPSGTYYLVTVKGSRQFIIVK